jgi:hypothetical protein
MILAELEERISGGKSAELKMGLKLLIVVGVTRRLRLS